MPLKFLFFPVSIMSISMMVGILSSGFISDQLGLKVCLILGCAVQTLGWVMLFWAPDFLVLIAGRIVSGIGSGKITFYPNTSCLFCLTFQMNLLTSVVDWIVRASITINIVVSGDRQFKSRLGLCMVLAVNNFNSIGEPTSHKGQQ